MVGTRTALASVVELKQQIRIAKQRKKYLEEYLQNLHQSYTKGKISYSFYVETLHLHRDGKTIESWIKYYENRILEYQKLIGKNRRNLVGNQLTIIFFSFILIFLVFMASIYIQPELTGFLVQDVEIPEVVTEANATITTTQQQAILGQPVKWIKTISLSNSSAIKIRLPVEATNISVNKISYSEEALLKEDSSPSQEEPFSSDANLFAESNRISDSSSETKFRITGAVISETQEGFLSKFFRNFGRITGQAIQEPTLLQEIEINDTATEYEVEYYTDAPYSIEEDIERGKRVKIIGPETIHYENVLAFTNLDESLNIRSPSQVKIHWIENNSFISPTSVQDTDNNGIYDYIEWQVQSLSEQTFDIIVITKAEHLDSNREFISDIYEEVKELDNVWSEEIPSGDYVRVTFEIPLDSSRDITIYPRITSGTPRIEVYEFNQSVLIATFDSLTSNEYNTVFLTGLDETQDVFDLRILDGAVEFDHIVDPAKIAWTITTPVSPNEGDSFTIQINGTCAGGALCEGSMDLAHDVQAGGCSPTAPLLSICGSTIRQDSWSGSSGACTFAQVDSNTMNYSCAQDESIGFFADVFACTGSTTTYEIKTITSDTTGGKTENCIADLVITAGDSTPPTIIIDSPKNTTLGPEVDYVITVDETLDVAFASVDSGANITMGNTGLRYFNLSTDRSSLNAGLHNITFWVNDTAGNANTTSTQFFTVDATIPLVQFVDPTPPNASTEPSDIYVNISSSDANDHYAFVDFNNDLFLWLRMDDINSSGDPTDLSSYGNNGTLQGDAFIISDGKFGKTTQFDGINEAPPDAINVSGLNSDPRFNESFTVSTWINSREIDASRDILGTITGAAAGWKLEVTAQERIRFQGWNGTADIIAQSAAGLLTADSWFHVVGVYNKSVPDMKIYVNGVLGGTTTVGVSTTGFGNSLDFLIGVTTNSVWNGSIDEVLLFNRSLVLDEIIALNATKQYEHNFTNLTDGTYTFTGYAVDIAGNKNQTDLRTVIIGTGVDNTPPTYSNNQTNTTIAGAAVNFSILWNDNTALHPNGQYVFSWNNSGVFVNDSVVNFTTTPEWANVTKTLNSTVGLPIGYRWYANDSAGNTNNTELFVLITTSANQAPTITFVDAIVEITPNESGVNYTIFNFTATDTDGGNTINISTAEARFQLAGEITRLNTTCINTTGAIGNDLNFTCTIGMWYFDKAATNWAINVTIKDNNDASGENSSTNFTFNLLTSMVMSPTSLNWTEINVTSTNIGSNDPIVVNNTGNAESLSINITGFNLRGEEFTNQFIYAANFTVNNVTADCAGGIQMSNATSLNVTSSILQRGNNSLNYNNATSGQEELFFCVTAVNSDLLAQSYSSAAYGAWEIKILLAVAVIPTRKRKKKKKRIKDNKLIEALDLVEYLNIADKLKEKSLLTDEEIVKTVIDKLSKKYKISRGEFLRIIKAREEITIPVTIFSKKLGALESIVKYMKENLGMNYREIEKEIHRDQRTIWTAYKKANEKMKKKMEIVKTDIMFPTFIFENKELTILESIIIYLKEKGRKYSEIAELLNRDQRNIWTIYSRAIKKLKKSEEKNRT